MTVRSAVATLITVQVTFTLACAASRAGELPEADGNRHLGVGSCSAAPCHGRTNPGAQAVAQDEYVTWARKDPHAGAFETLKSEKSEHIARKLGLGEPAYEATLCLDCHADNVPAELRGASFALEDGVGCEACHGGSERWLERHDKGGSRDTYLELGMYPTDDPVAQAELCLSCHEGNRDKFVKHRLLGAGHPRVRFELRVFGRTQPPHYTVDDDYRTRGKNAADGAQIWAIGQAIAVREMIDGMLDPAVGHEGMWPEFAFFDCHACHHSFSQERWRPRASTGLGPGSVRVNDANLLMLRHALAVLDPEAAEALGREIRALHRATSLAGGNPRAAAMKVRERAVSAIDAFTAWDVDVAAVRSILDRVLAEGIAGEYRDFAGAEQASMAVQALVENLYSLGAVDLASADHLFESNDALLDSLMTADRFNPAVVMHAFEDLRSML